jgi:hypothetical protein
MANSPIYGTRPNQAGWQRSIVNYPYENLLGNAEEKANKAVSGSGIVDVTERGK